MLDKIFSSILGTQLTAINFLICSAVSLLLGLLLSLAHTFKNRTTKSFAITIALLPLIVQVIIMLVNGNLGTGIAVAGAFSLVRFRSVPGNAKEILSIFMAMAAGLATGVGYIGVSIVFVMILVIANFVYTQLNLGDSGKLARELKIVIPEDLNYTETFNEVFEKYTGFNRLKAVKTTNMGSLFKLTYSVTLKKNADERKFINELRTLNSNLEIVCSYSPTVNEEL